MDEGLRFFRSKGGSPDKLFWSEGMQYSNFGQNFNIPKYCKICPFLFEGDCFWNESNSNFILEIFEVRLSRENTFNPNFENIIQSFQPYNKSICISLSIEGDENKITVADIQRIHCAIYTDLQLKKSLLFSFYPNPLLIDGIKVSIVYLSEDP